MSAAALESRPGDIERFFNLSMDLLAIASTRTGHWVLVNASFTRVLGWTAEELLATPFLDIVHPDDLERSTKAISLLSDGHPLTRFQNRVRCSDGSYRWIEWQTTPYMEEGLIYCAGRDIHSRKEMEMALSESEERLRIAKNAARLGIHDYDVLTNTIRWDWRVRELWGIGPDEPVTFETLLDGVHPDDRAAVVDAIERAFDIDGDGWFYTEYRVIGRSDGLTRWVAATGQATFVHGRAVRLVGTVQDISERKQSEEQLRASEDRFRTLADNIAQLAWMADASGSIFWYNRRWYDYTGTTFDQVQGWGWRQVHHPDRVHRVVERIKRSFESGEAWEDTFPLRRKDGTYRWFLSRALPIRDSEGRVVRWFGTSTDITGRLETEGRLGQSEARYRALFESMSEGFAVGEIIRDSEGAPVDWRYLQVNAAFEAMHHMPRAHIVGRTFRELFPEARWEFWVPQVAEVARTGKPIRLQQSDSGRYWEANVYCPAPGQFAIVFNDVTERKAAENAMRESEERFRHTFENAAVGIAHVGLDGKWLRVNQRLCEITGYAEDELLKLSFDDITHPEDLEADWAEARRLLAGEIDSYSTEKRYRRKDGSLVWVNLTGALQRDSAGAPQNFICVIQDINARKLAEEQTERLMAELQAAERRLQAVMDQMPSGLFMVEAPSGRIVAYNAEAERLLGHPAIASPEHTEYASYGAVHEDGTAYGAAEYPTARAVFHDETVRQEHMLYRRGDGGIVHLSVNAAPLKDGTATVGAVCTFHDITEQKKLETTLTEIKERLSLALQANRLGTWDWDIGSGAVLWGGYACRLLGGGDEHPEGTPEGFFSRVHPDDRETIRGKLERAMAAQAEDYHHEYRVVWPDGAVRWLEDRARIFYSADGQARRMVGVVQDVTSRRAAEDEIRAAERQLRLALEAAQAGTFDIDPAGGIPPIVSEGAKKLFGFTPESQPALEDFVGRVYPEDRPDVVATIQRSVETGEGHFLEYRVVRPDGSESWLASRAEAVWEGGGHSRRLIGALIDITARKRFEEALRESEARLRAIYDGTYEYIGLLAPDGTLLETNRASLEFADNAREDVVGRPFWDTPWFAATPGAAETMRHAVGRAAVGEFMRYEATLNRPSGERLTLDVSLHPIRDQSGQVVLIVPEGRDITERRRAEQALRMREAELQVERDRLEKIFAQAPALFAVVRGPQHTFELANAAYYQLVGHREIVGKPLLEALPELCGQGFDRLLDQVLETGEPFVGSGMPLRIQRRPECDPEEIFVDFVYAPLTEADGSRSGAVTIGYEVTERVRAEEAERSLREGLARNAAEFQQIADTLPQLVWVVRPDGYHEWFNSRWCEYTGSTLEQSCGENWVAFIHPDVVGEVRRHWDHCVAAGEPYQMETRIRRHDGSWRWFLARAEPIRDEAGTIRRWFGTCTDIDGQKRTEEALRSSNQDLERFAYMASHDLQEPLRVVASYTQLLARRYKGQFDERGDEFIRMVLEATQRMSRLIQDLLIYARSTGGSDLKLQSTDVNTVLALALANLRSRIDETSATVTWDRLPVLPSVVGLLVQVFQNLIGNALKYNRPDVAPEIHVSAEPRDGEWVLSVRDNGVGIAPEHRHKVFQLFSRLHGREVSGSGIGLATVKRIIERHGGRVWLESEPGVGSTFWFSLPAEDAASE